ncbi:protocadherin Fat 4-like [Conger conger]|uniref:protocadherin Fat 4-like n=1 Tax=Conger conger TaxID=82655 RepID=UPI002A5A019A|nr:protocadherin Fat 4-like [Conger conger]
MSEFKFGPENGVIVLKKRFNFNIVSDYSFTVEARDDGGLFDRATVNILVEDFDNMNPYFTQSLYRAVIQEDQMGGFLSILPEAILARDGDIGINQTLVYSIRAVSPDQYTSSFSIDPASGIITVVKGLDREEVTMATLNIQAAQTDDSLKTAEASLLVTVEDVNDNAPEFDAAVYAADILENSPEGSFVLRVRVTDRDEGGFNGTLQIIPESVPFAITPDGALQVKNSTALDREQTPRLSFQIEAREDAPPNRVVLADVVVTLLDANDNNPQFESANYEGMIFKNQTVGMTVATVHADDLDEGANGRVSYAIEGGNQDEYFSINAETGQITLMKEVVFQENEYLQFLLFVTASDGGEVTRFSSTQVRILAPGTSNPQFLLPSYHGSLQEEMDPPVQILKLTFLPPGIGVTLAVLSEMDKFSVEPDGTFLTLVRLDHEVRTNYSVRVSISDGTSSDETTVLVDVIDINDNTPVFASGPVKVDVGEDAELGANVTELAASDADSGFNGELFYSLRGGEGKFSIDPQSAMISLAGTLDREAQAEYTLEVVARDQGQPPRSSSAVVVVNVTDVNDNSPRFPQAQYEEVVPENFTVGTTILVLTATDPDQGSNALVTYRIAQQSPSTDPPVFILDPASGTLWLNTPLDFGKASGYTLTVEAVDGGTPALNGTCLVAVRVQDLNNEPPKFSRDRYDIATFESLPSGTAILTLEVTDEDEAGFSNGHFLLNSDTFSINTQGTLSLNRNATLDREQQDNYLLQVVAVDSATDGLSATAQLNITVLDVNDNNPQFLPLPDPIVLPEGNYSAQAPLEVCSISTSDLDQGDNGKVTLSLSNPGAPFQFTEDGMLLAVGPLDREEKDTYDLVIAASDHGSPQRKNVTYITVTVTDVNDNAPEFSQGVYSRDILVKDAAVGDLVLTLSATDRDAGVNANITYSFSAGSPLLSLDSKTGDITLTSDLSGVTKDTVLEVTAVAQDQGEPQRSSTAMVEVSLFTVSLTPGVDFQSPAYNFSVAENEPAGAAVGVVKALTGSSLTQVTYALGSHTDLFAVDEEGVVSTLQPLDAETQEWYNMAVEATDSRTPPNTAVTMVSVRVEDVNEAPVFNNSVYSANIFSIAPYKYPVLQVEATDPDVGQTGQLVYSLEQDSGLLEVEPSSGRVYVVSVEGQAGEKTLTVRATDPQGLRATAEVKVTIQESEAADTVVISLNQPINTVDEKFVELESSLEIALDWTVKVLSITSISTFGGGARSSRETGKTYVTFIAMDAASAIVPYEDVERKLQSERDAVTAELAKVFGQEVEHALEAGPGEPDSSQQTVVIVLGVLLALSMLGLVAVVVTMVVKSRKHSKGGKESSPKDMVSFGNHYQEHRNSLASESGSSNQEANPERKTSTRKSSNSGNSHTSAL